MQTHRHTCTWVSFWVHGDSPYIYILYIYIHILYTVTYCIWCGILQKPGQSLTAFRDWGRTLVVAWRLGTQRLARKPPGMGWENSHTEENSIWLQIACEIPYFCREEHKFTSYIKLSQASPGTRVWTHSHIFDGQKHIYIYNFLSCSLDQAGCDYQDSPCLLSNCRGTGEQIEGIPVVLLLFLCFPHVSCFLLVSAGSSFNHV